MKREQVARIKESLQGIQMEFKPENLSKIIQVVSDETHLNKMLVRHVICCGYISENGTSIQYNLPPTDLCMRLKNESSIIVYNNLLDEKDPNHKKKHFVELSSVFSTQEKNNDTSSFKKGLFELMDREYNPIC